MKSKKIICYAASPYGYAVQVVKGGNLIDEQHFGNLSQDSTETVSPDSPYAVSEDELLAMAERAAKEIAAEHGVDAVFYDEDLANELNENGDGEF